MEQTQFAKPIEYKKPVGWYCIGTKNLNETTAFATRKKPNAIKRFLMRTLLDFYWIKN